MTPIETLAQTIQLARCGPFEMMTTISQLAGVSWADAIMEDWSDHDRTYVGPDAPRIAGGPVQARKKKIPAEFAEIFWRFGGRWPGYTAADIEQGIDIESSHHPDQDRVWQLIVIDRRVDDPPYSPPRSGPKRDPTWAAARGWLPQLHYAHDPFLKGSIGNTLAQAIGVLVRQGVDQPRKILAPLARIEGLEIGEALSI